MRGENEKMRKLHRNQSCPNESLRRVFCWSHSKSVQMIHRKIFPLLSTLRALLAPICFTLIDYANTTWSNVISSQHYHFYQIFDSPNWISSTYSNYLQNDKENYQNSDFCFFIILIFHWLRWKQAHSCSFLTVSLLEVLSRFLAKRLQFLSLNINFINSILFQNWQRVEAESSPEFYSLLFFDTIYIYHLFCIPELILVLKMVI